MTISLDESVVEVRRYFRDVKWSNETLKAWVKDAVREYSNHFPLIKEVSGAATTGTYEYVFDYLVTGVIECEYPTGEDPPKFPEQRNHREPHFFDDGLSYYDLVAYPGENAAEIWLSDPVTGTNYNIKFQTEHEWTANGSDYEADIPDSSRHIIIQYAIWQCWREMLTIEKENTDKDRKDFLTKQVDKAAKSYMTMITSLKETMAAESEFVKWEMDKFDRIY